MPAKPSIAKVAGEHLALPWLELSAKITQCEDTQLLASMLRIELQTHARYYVMDRIYGKLALLMRERDLELLATGRLPSWIDSL